MKRLYDLILFDFDGTLVNSKYAIRHCMENTLLENDLEVPEHKVMEGTIGLPLAECFSRMTRENIDSDTALALADHYRRLWFSGGKDLMQLFTGVRTMLGALQAAGAALAIVSNKRQDGLDDGVASLGLGEYFEAVIGLDHGRSHKPDPSLFHDHVSPLFQGISPNRILMVGDAPPDLLFARNAGLHSCWVTYGYGSSDECIPHSPNHVAHTVAEIARRATGQE